MNVFKEWTRNVFATVLSMSKRRRNYQSGWRVAHNLGRCDVQRLVAGVVGAVLLEVTRMTGVFAFDRRGL